MQPQNQTVLTGIIAFVLVSSFAGVYAVNYYYDSNGVTEVCMTSDSDMEFVMGIDYEPDDLSPWGDTSGTGSFKWSGSPSPSLTSINVKNNCTPLYLGNDTWGTTMTGFAGETPSYSGAYHQISIAMPCAKTYLIENITIDMTVASGSTILIGVGGFNDPQIDTNVGGYTIVPYTDIETQTTYSETITLNNVQALGWYSIAQARDTPTLNIYLYDIDRDGLNTFALEFNMEVTGQAITTWSLQNYINLVLGVSIGFNIFIMIFMSDAVDFGGYRNDLKRR